MTNSYIARLTNPSDVAFWVSRDTFCEKCDQSDFRCREVLHVDIIFSQQWFEDNENGQLCFLLPTVRLASGKTEFINGRHRTAVLLSTCNRVPIAFAGPDAVSFAESLALNRIAAEREIQLPDLEIVNNI
ncbi:MAG: hypothetical protein GVY36_13430 [Verrucomicrobia bacterium]|jgi:hypothetical protein|nr:hypothetical protein [Verrucomicrobiota bacterium]